MVGYEPVRTRLKDRLAIDYHFVRGNGTAAAPAEALIVLMTPEYRHLVTFSFYDAIKR